jgi:hypothetical protein
MSSAAEPSSSASAASSSEVVFKKRKVSAHASRRKADNADEADGGAEPSKGADDADEEAVDSIRFVIA